MQMTLSSCEESIKRLLSEIDDFLNTGEQKLRAHSEFDLHLLQPFSYKSRHPSPPQKKRRQKKTGKSQIYTQIEEDSKEAFYLNKLFSQSKAIEDILAKIEQAQSGPQDSLRDCLSQAKLNNKYLLESEMLSQQMPKPTVEPKPARASRRRRNEPHTSSKKKANLRTEAKRGRRTARKSGVSRPSQNLRYFRKLQKELERESRTRESELEKRVEGREQKEAIKKSSNFLEILDSEQMREYERWEAQLLKMSKMAEKEGVDK